MKKRKPYKWTMWACVDKSAPEAWTPMLYFEHDLARTFAKRLWRKRIIRVEVREIRRKR